jgi:DNA replication protein DnaC
MMIGQTITQLRQLKLTGMALALETQSEQPGTYEGLSFDERIHLLVENESLERDNRKHRRRLKAAKLKLAANGREIDYQHPRGLQQSQMAGLLLCGWLAKAQNILLTGPCGTGKTYLACALGHTACMKGFTTKYCRISRLLLELTQAKADGTYSKLLNAISKIDLLIIDDWGLEPLKAAARNDLMEIMDDRHGQGATIVLSQLPTDQWHQSIGDNTIADAILDRLMHNAHRIKLKGESMRKTQNSLTERDHLA